MDTPSLQSLTEAAQGYESLFVPALFGQWAGRVADAANLRPGEQALDVACGTGVLAREALKRVGDTGYVAAIDPGPGMLAIAKEYEAGVDWREGVAENLPFPGQSFDAVLCQFGLMFFHDRAKSIAEMLRVARPGGRLAVAVWDSIENIPAYSAELDLIERMAGKEAAEAVRVPFVLGHRDALVTLFQEAGASHIDVTTHRGTAHFPAIRTMVEAELTGWLPVMGVSLAQELIEEILHRAESSLRSFAAPEGSVNFEVSAHIITAVRS
jgi:SAM-dependent methyltransferase